MLSTMFESSSSSSSASEEEEDEEDEEEEKRCCPKLPAHEERRGTRPAAGKPRQLAFPQDIDLANIRRLISLHRLPSEGENMKIESNSGSGIGSQSRQV